MCKKNVEKCAKIMCKVNFDRSWLTFLQSRVELAGFSSGEDVRSRFFDLWYGGENENFVALDVLLFQPLAFS